jgi:hypothetical protein
VVCDGRRTIVSAATRKRSALWPAAALRGPCPGQIASKCLGIWQSRPLWLPRGTLIHSRVGFGVLPSVACRDLRDSQLWR